MGLIQPITTREKASALNSIVSTYLLRGGFYLLIFGVCATALGLAQRQPLALPSSRSQPSPTVRPTPTPRARPANRALDKSVAWQNNAVHDGLNANSTLVTPLVLRWSREFRGATSISYPLIAQGLVFVTVETDQGETLIALSQQTGGTVWSADVNGLYGFANAAYDAGKVFVVNFDGLTKAFNASTGTLLWSVDLADQFGNFTSPPTAVNGIVFTSGQSVLYAVDERNGAILWTMLVEYGDHSSPAVTQGSVYVSYACPQAYGFNATTGQELWHYSSCCSGGGGKTPVVHVGQVYVRDSFCGNTSGLVLNATTGDKTGEFNCDGPPAFIGNLALYLQSGTLRGVDIPSGQELWSFAGDGGLTSAPLIVNQTIRSEEHTFELQSHSFISY